MLNRLKQPHVILLIATLLYQLLEVNGLGIDAVVFQDIVDLITFVLFGFTIYKSDKDNII